MSIFEEQGDQPKHEEEQVDQQETPKDQESTPPKSEESQFEAMLKGITNQEGKPKYTSVEQALGSIPHAQKHIGQLEQDNQTLKEQLDALTEQVNEYKQQVDRFGSVEDILSEKQQQGLTEEQIAEISRRTWQAEKQSETQKQNVNSVANSLVEMYGDRALAEKEFLAMQEDLGIDLAELSAKSPKAVLRYFKKEKAKTPDSFESTKRMDFKKDEPAPKARMPRTTKESIEGWRASAQAVREKHGLTD